MRWALLVVLLVSGCAFFSETITVTGTVLEYGSSYRILTDDLVYDVVNSKEAAEALVPILGKSAEIRGSVPKNSTALTVTHVNGQPI